MSEPANKISFLREALINNMKSREKPSETSNQNENPSEPMKVIKSDKMKNMLEAMNKHFDRSSSANDEPIKIIECSGGPGVPPPPPPPPPPPMAGGPKKNIIKKNNINQETVIIKNTISEPPKGGIPPPPPPPPPPVFDPNKVIKKPKKEVKKKPPPASVSAPTVNSGPSMKEQLMKAMKKIGK